MKLHIPMMDKIAKAIDKREEKKEPEPKPVDNPVKQEESDPALKKVEKFDSKMDIQLTKSESRKSLGKMNLFKYSYVS
jgi:dihydropteroate synthase